MTWEAIRKSIVEKLNEADNPKEAPKAGSKAEPKKAEEPGTIGPLEDESIRLLKNAVADKSVKLRRAGSVFSLVVPLAKQDGAEVTATFDLAKATVAERIQAGKKVEQGVINLFNLVHVHYADGSGLEVSVDLAKLAKIQKNDDPKPDEKKAAGYKSTIEGLRAHGIDIKAKFSIKSLVDEYLN